MQKASVGFERAKEAEKELKKEQKRAERAERENAQYSQSLKETRAEVEALRSENADLVKRSEEVEQGLGNQLAAAEAKAEAEYDRAVLEVTANYKAQMPAVQDAIWGAAWRRCLEKLGIEESSPHWVNMELPSEMASAEAYPDAQVLPDQPMHSPEPTQTEDTVPGLTITEDGNTESSVGGNGPDSNLAIDADQLDEEA
jgi:hypothetical protein